ncbi:MAG: CYTH domain-containing protein [Candidatus Latescibacterota bacterium]|nr:CYTH domain-containing protein [Candidatus Latescibacterota bacterium]
MRAGVRQKPSRMGQEIERKFLVADPSFLTSLSGSHVKQGYIPGKTRSAARIRVRDGIGFLTLKSETRGITRNEFEYEIPLDDAEEMLNGLCEPPLIEKTRYFVEWKSHAWEIDVFHGDNEGLIVAEIELATADQAFVKPPWLGREVSLDARYFNSNLARTPYVDWRDSV